MDANRKPHVRPKSGNTGRLSAFLFVAGLENDQRSIQAGSPGPSDDHFEVRAERLVGKMAV